MKNNESMLTQSPGRALFFFALPMVLGNLFQQFYNIADSIIVGNFCGSNSLAAVSASFAIIMLFMCVAIGSGIGCGVVISQFWGARRYNSVKTAIKTSLISSLAVSLVLMGLGLIANKGILALMGTPEEIYNEAVIYLAVYLTGLPFMFIYNNATSIFNALGESKIPLYFLIFSSFLNIALDIVFITVFDRGVAGAAEATVISQAVAAILLVVVLVHRVKHVGDKSKSKMFDVKMLGKMYKVAVPSIVQQSIVSVGIMLVQVVINTFSVEVVSGAAAAVKIDSVAIVPLLGVGNAMSTFAAQNIGANQPDRVVRGYRAAVRMALAIGSCVVLVILLFTPQFVGMFLKKDVDKAVIDAGVQYLRTIGVFYVAFGLMNVTTAILRGSGDLMRFMLCSFLSLGTRVAVAYWAVYGTDFSVNTKQILVWSSNSIGWVIAFCVAYMFYKQGHWRKKSLVD